MICLVRFVTVPLCVSILIISIVAYNCPSMISTVSPIQFSYAFSQQQQYSSLASSRNHDRAMRSTMTNRMSPHVIAQKSNGILLQSEAYPQESKQELCIKPNQHRSFRKLRRWSLQNLSCVLFQPKRWIRQIRWYVWFLSIFLSWNVAIPKTIAETSSPAMETATTLLSRSIRPQLTNNANEDPQNDNGQVILVAQPPYNGNSFHSKTGTNHNRGNNGHVRLVTSAAVILATSAIGISKVNRREQRGDNSIESNMNETNANQDTAANNGSQLTWLLPRNKDIDDETPGKTGSISNIGAANPSPTQIPAFSQRKTSSKDMTKVMDRLKQVSQPAEIVTTNSDKPYSAEKLSWYAKSIGKSTSWQPPKPVSDDIPLPNIFASDMSYSAEKLSWFAKRVAKSVPKQRLQQPKPMLEETQLQAKYASIESLEERAFTILKDLGMVESTPDPFGSAWH